MTVRELLEQQNGMLQEAIGFLKRQDERLTAAERREVEAELRKAERLDRPPQRPLHKFTFATFAKALPGFWEQFKPVPEKFWMWTSSGAGEPDRARVKCPCGQKPELVWAELQQCECERWYVLLNRGVHVANSPQARS